MRDSHHHNSKAKAQAIHQSGGSLGWAVPINTEAISSEEDLPKAKHLIRDSPLESSRVNSLPALPEKPPNPNLQSSPLSFTASLSVFVHLTVPSVVMEYRIPIATNNFHQQ